MSMVVPVGQTQPQNTRPSKMLRPTTGSANHSNGRMILRSEIIAERERSGSARR
jgi:hypothetical protein